MSAETKSLWVPIILKVVVVVVVLALAYYFIVPGHKLTD